MKTEGRSAWNAMPGYARAERHQANHPSGEAAFDALECGIDAGTLRDFLEEPSKAVGMKIAKACSDLRGDLEKMEEWLANPEHDYLPTLVMRMATVLIMAERERVEHEAEVARQRKG